MSTYHDHAFHTTLDITRKKRMRSNPRLQEMSICLFGQGQHKNNQEIIYTEALNYNIKTMNIKKN